MNETGKRIILEQELAELLTPENASPYAKSLMKEGMSNYDIRRLLAFHFLEEYRRLLNEFDDPTDAKRELAKRYNLTPEQKSKIKGMEGI